MNQPQNERLVSTATLHAWLAGYLARHYAQQAEGRFRSRVLEGFWRVGSGVARGEAFAASKAFFARSGVVRISRSPR